MSNRSAAVALIIGIAALILAIVAVSVAGALAPVAKGDTAEQDTDIQYVMYLGTNDKDTNMPVFSPEESKVKAEEILINHFGGFTIQEASGGWIDEGKVYREYTLVIYLSDTDIDQVHAAASELKEVFNQSSVLIQANRTTTEFYEG